MKFEEMIDTIEEQSKKITNLEDENEDLKITKAGQKATIEILKEENERLKNGYCDLKVKCNNGECDCTNEEYEGMVQAN